MAFDRMVLLVLAIVIIFIIVVFALYITNQQDQMGSTMTIVNQCPEWQRKGCSFESANDIMIPVKDSSPVSLAYLCSKQYSTLTWNQNAWDGCKRLCQGCTVYQKA
jgi:hypothetical protein